MDNCIIRLAEKSDIKSVHELQVQWCNENITYGFVPGGENYLSSKLGEYFFVAEKDTEVIGFTKVFKSGGNYILN